MLFSFIVLAFVSVSMAQAQPNPNSTFVTFTVVTPYGYKQSCHVLSFREVFSQGPDLAPLFKNCAASSIPPGTYRFDLGNNRNGVLVVSGSRVLKIVEDVDVPKGFAISLAPPTEVQGKLEGVGKSESSRLRLRIVSLWGTYSSDSKIDEQGNFYFASVPCGSHVILLIRDNRSIGSKHFDKGSRPDTDIKLFFAKMMDP